MRSILWSWPLGQLLLCVFTERINSERYGNITMEVKLLRASREDAAQIHEMQKEAFRELLDKYQDFDTSPGNETVEKLLG